MTTIAHSNASTQTLESQPLQNRVAVSTPEIVSIDILVKQVATRKTKIGETFSNTKGKQSLFSGVCAAYKSMKGLDKGVRLDEATVKEINQEIAKFWHNKAIDLLEYGQMVSVSFDKPSLVWNEGKVEDVKLNARMHARKECRDDKERKLMAIFQLNAAKRRMDTMLENPQKYSRELLASQSQKIEAIKLYINNLTEQEKPTEAEASSDNN